MLDNSRIILVTHNDLDGIMCAILFRLMFYFNNDEETPILFCSNATRVADAFNKLKTPLNVATDKIIFTDIVADRPTMEDLVSKGFNIEVYDHHKTVTWLPEVLPGWSVTVANENGVPECGASIFLKACEEQTEGIYNNHFFKMPLLKELVKCTRDWDTFEWVKNNNLDARRLQVMFYMLGRDVFINNIMAKLCDTTDNYYPAMFSDIELAFVNASIAKDDRIINEFTEDKVVKMQIGKYTAALCISAPTSVNFSMLANSFLRRYPEYDFFAGYIFGGVIEMSFRSTEDKCDVGVLAKKIGGGGHKNASGNNSKALNDEVKALLLDYMVKLLKKGVEE